MTKKRLVIKMGTATLTAGTNRFSYAKLEDLARQIITLQEDYDIIIVSSGAIAAARQFVDISGLDEQINSKQAMAAIGQPKLMLLYDEVFSSFGLKIAQCLMTYMAFENEHSKLNTQNTLLKLVQHGYIPIVNENDTVSYEEIILGDNDKLSAFVASVVHADLLILASDIDGVYDQNPHLYSQAKLLHTITDLGQISSFVQEKESALGTGGMTSKIQAAEICKKHHVEMWIVNGMNNNFVIDSLNDKKPCTKFLFSPKRDL